ncbi:MAG: hypothetical protein WD534_10310 [Phycisphaeraceae bacterium]
MKQVLSRQRRRRCHGVTMIDMLALMALLGVFMLMTGHLFTQAMTITRDGARYEQDVTQIDALVRHLRQDVWQASQLDAVDEQRLALTLGESTRVTWRITRETSEMDEPATHIVREITDGADAAEPTRFVVRAPVRVAAAGPGVRLYVGEQSVTLVNQVRLLEVSR